ncbi:uncharacterized protein AMSG_09343 [Thecamonas trahens ATCC 50062]|uniref:Uncharacterized protein n=1 Tax=Thecamonas trahens ATCC 50062 TaxID=461836 RepID=A0A0L0DLZ2_THETB|nr:hypothetical protein AMSG_09343 [Thecamonas trahens ATCC 50062]KNC53051.1 hypothetical protein AMSG_09343 [Thecamonas trahens ATCC 50062]|eukprot:XP_013754728.1 hypothetical protein AMSG_09343 [Thecamonas trahens ATCC 50062]
MSSDSGSVSASPTSASTSSASSTGRSGRSTSSSSNSDNNTNLRRAERARRRQRQTKQRRPSPDLSSTSEDEFRGKNRRSRGKGKGKEGKGKGKGDHGRADEPHVEPRYYALQSRDEISLSELLGEDSSGLDWLSAAGLMPRRRRRIEAVLFCDAHNVLEVGGELNGAVVALLNKAMAAGVYVVVLSWVGWTSLAKVAQDIAHMAAGLGSGTCSGSGSGSGSDSGSGGLRLDHRVPIVTCTGNRVAKMALVGMVADVLEQPVALLDDSDRNLEAAFSTSNMAAVAEGFGVMPSITGLYMLYVKKGTRAEGGVVSGRQYKRRVRKTVESALARTSSPTQ